MRKAVIKILGFLLAISLANNSFAAVIFSENFESSLGADWSTYKSNSSYGRNERTTYSANAGNYSWRMDVTSNGTGNLNELILHLNVSGYSSLSLSFATIEYSDEGNTMSSSFSGHENSDGIAVSNDGTSWYNLWQYPSRLGNWTGYGPLDIGTVISISGDVYIKFQQYDDYEISTDGILWDDITVEGTTSAGADDSYEDDDGFSQYTSITVGTSESSQSRTIYPTGDYDYIRFYAYSDYTYSFYTTGSVDTAGTIYTSGQSFMTSDNDSGTGNNFSITWDCTSSGYYYLVINENGNDSTGSYTFYYSRVSSSGPDLIITSVNAPSSANAGDYISVSYTIKNNGTTLAGGSYTHFYLSTDSTYDGGDTLLNYDYVNSLPAGSNTSNTVYMTIPSGTSDGSYYIIAYADGWNYVTESNENNNTAYDTINIGAGYGDISDVIAYPSVFSPYYSNITITNLPAATKIRIYDLNGKLVKSFSGYGNMLWDGRDSSGSILPSGAYIIYVESGGLTKILKVCLLREK